MSTRPSSRTTTPRLSDQTTPIWCGRVRRSSSRNCGCPRSRGSAARPKLAIGRFEIDDGLALLHRALALEPDEADKAALWREVGRANVFKLDGEAFWTAMMNSLEGTTDRATVADTYSILAFQTATRAAMWKRRPDRELIAGWIDRALELSEPDTPARARALIARVNFDPERSGAAAQEAIELADRIDDMELRSWAWDARSTAAYARGDYDESYAWARRRFDIVPTVTDPDHIALIYMFGLPACLTTGRFQEARRSRRRMTR